MNVLFLDYDGVVNTPMWEYDEKLKRMRCRYNTHTDKKVNNFQAVQWVSEFCEKFNYSIVVTSTWRKWDGYKECLINAGLRDGIQILGATPIFHTYRGYEISAYLEDHSEVTGYLIFDDESDMTIHTHRLVKCNDAYGFGEDEYFKAEKLHSILNKKINME